MLIGVEVRLLSCWGLEAGDWLPGVEKSAEKGREKRLNMEVIVGAFMDAA